ncbi:hypothetical protein E3U23_07505 [Erythrobacter litoralis]|uniref:hypothetical protein n=1 Tax=Erythrobacter litoralis TaxID=39960 RepID=UPI0024351446|nr:hypothetical protein [Erythrobacter litoralis]MDG6079036.1 hypothetical protein [Erythrobacter litoralis]
MPNGRFGPTVAQSRHSQEEYLDHVRAETLARVTQAIARMVAEGVFPSARAVSRLAGCSPNLFDSAPVHEVYRKSLADEQRRFVELHPDAGITENRFIDHAIRKNASGQKASSSKENCKCAVSARLRRENEELKRRLKALLSDPMPLREKFDPARR